MTDYYIQRLQLVEDAASEYIKELREARELKKKRNAATCLKVAEGENIPCWSVDMLREHPENMCQECQLAITLHEKRKDTVKRRGRALRALEKLLK